MEIIIFLAIIGGKGNMEKKVIYSKDLIIVMHANVTYRSIKVELD